LNHTPRVVIVTGWYATLGALIHGRYQEAGIAFRTVLFGAFLLATPHSMDSQAYLHLITFASENAWGGGAVLVGSVNLLALHINGKRRSATTVVRAACAWATLFYWCSFFYGFWTIDSWTTAVSIGLLWPVYSSCRAMVSAVKDVFRNRYGIAESSTWSG
jgi:hypothetical protein